MVSDNVYEVARESQSYYDGKPLSRPAAAINWKERKKAEGSKERNDEGCRAKPNCFPTKWFCARRRLASTPSSRVAINRLNGQRFSTFHFDAVNGVPFRYYLGGGGKRSWTRGNEPGGKKRKEKRRNSGEWGKIWANKGQLEGSRKYGYWFSMNAFFFNQGSPHVLFSILRT